MAEVERVADVKAACDEAVGDELDYLRDWVVAVAHSTPSGPDLARKITAQIDRRLRAHGRGP